MDFLTLGVAIPLRSLAYLTQSNNAMIQSGAVKIILDRAMSDKYLSYIINTCKKGNSNDSQEMAVSSLHLLTRRGAGILDVLVDALASEPPMSESTQRYAAVAICDLIQNSGNSKCYIIDLGILKPIKRILSSPSIRNNELKYWTLMILYQITRTEPFPNILVEEGFVSILAEMARSTYGNTNMPKFCLQSLIRIISNVEASVVKSILEELLQYRIIDLLSICLRAEDLELVYWAAGLMHEFVVKDVAAQQFRDIKGLHGILNGLLAAEEVYISRFVLRTIKFMAQGHEKFCLEMIHSDMVKKIMRSLKLEDDDVRYWSVMCISAVAPQVESHPDIINSDEFGLFLELTVSRKVNIAIFSSDILSLICCIGPMVSTLDRLLQMQELEVQYNAAGAIFNLMAMRDDFACHIKDQCLDTIISLCVSPTHERMQMTAAKSLVMMATKFRSIIPRIIYQVIKPLIKSTTDITQHTLTITLMQTFMKTSKYCDRKSGRKQQKRLNIKRRLRMSRIPAENDSDTDNGGSKLDIASSDSTSNPSTQTPFAMKTALPRPTRIQLAGALSALRIFLENGEIFGSVFNGTEEQLIRENLDKMNEVLEENDLDAYDAVSRTVARLSDLDGCIIPSGIGNYQHKDTWITENPLSRSMRKFVESVVFLSIYPVLSTWGTYHAKSSFASSAMDEKTAIRAYYDVIAWLRQTINDLLQDQSMASSRTANRGFIYDDSSEDSTEDEDDYGEGEEGESDPYMMSDKIESAAERLGETRRKGEEHDSATAEDFAGTGQRLYSAKAYSVFACRAWMILRSIVHHAAVRHFVIHELGLVEAMVYMLLNSRSLSDHALTCLGTMICADPSFIISEPVLRVMVVSIWKSAQMPMAHKRAFYFYARIILTYATRSISASTPPASCDNNPMFVEIDVHHRSKYCLLNYETRLEVRNDSWTFETVRSTHHTPPPGSDLWEAQPCHKYCFETVLATDDLMQIGWVSEDFGIDPEGGTGVGDDMYSYGYDGCRMKSWHAQYHGFRKNYGRRWAVGDTITCALDLDAGEIRFYQNGDELGVAFANVDTSAVWYPAASLSTGQECRFRFGGTLDKLRYLPEGYVPMAHVASLSASIELPPPQVNRRRTIGSEKSDEMDCLTTTLEPLDGKEMMDGYEEPSLRPIRMDPLPQEECSADIHGTTSASTTTAAAASMARTRQTLLSRCADEGDYSVLPSLYFEMMIGFQVRYHNDEDEIDGVYKDHHVRIEYKHHEKQGVLLQGAFAQSEPFHMDIVDGGVVGMAYIQEYNAVYITLNGEILVIVKLLLPTKGDEHFLPFLPYRSGNVKTHINYGDELFRWKRGNAISAKEKMRRYLGQLLSSDV
ncbi:hypothetical protein BX666DRAFT_2029445 [Dichotomocladium elegans]|nr:hypothetical protein BX666DRAFT_2029445 [Dichotomocladium elegans]